MTVQAIRLRNFMAFEDTQWISLADLNLLYGRNSAGKSTVIKALRLLKQSHLFRYRGSPFVYYDSDGLDIGGFEELLHNAENNSIGFGFRCLVPSRLLKDILWIEDEDDMTSAIAQDNFTVVDYQLDYAWNEKREKAELIVFSISTSEAGETKTILQVEVAEFVDSATSPSFIYITDYFVREIYAQQSASLWNDLKMNTNVGFLPDLELPPREVGKGFAEERKNISFINSLAVYLKQEILSFLDSMIHIPPVRPSPSHLFMLNSRDQRTWEAMGWGSFLHLLRSELKEDEKERLEEWLERLELGRAIRISQYSPEPGKVLLSSLSVEDLGSSKNINIENMGFGGSQVIPVVLTTLLAKPDSVLLIEQPELHLHPEIQAVLADFFVDQIGRGKRFIIETHSEYLLLRLQRRIAETTLENYLLKQQLKPPEDLTSSTVQVRLSPENFHLIFVHRTRNSSIVEMIGIDEYGDLISPSQTFMDFFKRDYEDVMQLDHAHAELNRLTNAQ